MMKRVSIIAASLFMITASLLSFGSSASAEGLSLGISANNRAVGTNASMLTSSPLGTLEVGAGLMYNEDRYTIGSGLVSVKSDNLTPGLRYGLGFKYVLGSMKNKAKTERADLSALGFNLGAGYELPATINPFNIPIEVTGDMTLAPESITFDETKGYMDFTVGLRFYLIENAYLTLTHTYIDAEFDTGNSWSRYINETMCGVVLTY
ncbi:hypothetical protein [Desulfoluna butyratoxydans]|uniref:Outer membrane protein beta-barrel n=1 Tax=Desulfoluna butyratoxydans TaxID=231438 RepID=A0A4U8YHH3_9BACT|nr:hypothetical protein [Desulfoluna butyratoxydans]VFQ42700.1 hypothetical protein MSL71_3210 [Desulfoluna butyratoxydans]